MTTSATPASPIDYAERTIGRSTFNLFRGAIVCGVAPLIVGTSVFSIWLATRWSWLMTLGGLVIIGGIGAFLTGCVLLGLWVWNCLRTGVASRRFVYGRALLVAMLLLVNFPIAAVLVKAAIYLETQYTIVVVNAGSEPIDSFVISAPGIQQDVGPLLSGERKKARFHVAADGELTFTMSQRNAVITGTLDGYVTSGLGRDTLVTINGGAVVVAAR